MKRTHTKLLATLVALGTAALSLSVWNMRSGKRQVAGASKSTSSGAAEDTGSSLGAVGATKASDRASSDSSVSGGFYAAPVGREFTYELQGHSNVGIAMTVDDQLVQQALEHKVAGRMKVIVAARRDDEIVAACSFPDTHIDVVSGSASDRDTQLERAIARTCWVRMRDDGQLIGFRFDPQVDPQARNWIRSEIAAFRFEVDGTGAENWERTEVDPTGTAQTRYVRESEPAAEELRLRKTKLAYAPVRTGGDDAPIDVQPEVNSESTGVLSTSLAWLNEARVDERMVFSVERLGITTTLALTGSVRLVESGWVSVEELLAIDWNAEWGSVSGAEEMDALAELGEQSLRSRLLEGVTLDALLAELDVLATAKPRDNDALLDAQHKLAELLRDNEAALDTLAKLVGSMNAETADVVLSAVGAAGTAPAQRLLASVLGDANASNSLRQSSLDAMFQLRRPVSEAYGAIESLMSDASAGSALRANGMLVLGALSSMNPASGAEASEHIAGLLALEEQARTDHQLAHWLHALGNTGSPAIAAAALPYLGHADPLLRSAAAEALRGVGTAESISALSQRALSDTEASVRRSCAGILADSADAASQHTVRQILEHEPIVEVRRAAVDALARRAAGDAAARALLEYVASNDPSPELRARAAAAL